MIETASGLKHKTVYESQGKKEWQSGYNHPDYAASLRVFGEPMPLKSSGAWLLKQGIPHTDYDDARGCYPLFTSPDWQGLADDLERLATTSLISLTLVSDPFTPLTYKRLAEIFSDRCTPFKEHYIADLESQPHSFVSSHHRYYARRALRRYRIEIPENALQYLPTWHHLYQQLVQRHQINGITAFSYEAFATQMQIPGAVVFRAYEENETAGMQIWYVMGERVYHHLSAYSPAGYKNRVSYAMMWQALYYFYDLGFRWLDLGGGAGLRDTKDGLTQFKKGWSNTTRTAYLCGKILQPEAYKRLQDQTGMAESRYFPAYRAPDAKYQTLQRARQKGTSNDTDREAYRRNEALEELLAEINGLLAQPESRILKSYSKPQKPLVLVVGAPRSGTTLLLQWLAYSGYFGYVSNFVARFYQAPYVGARIQQMMSDRRFTFRNEMLTLPDNSEDMFRSELGKTDGLLAPNEFWYFWRRFFRFDKADQLNEEALHQVDWHTFRSELAALEAVWQRPLALKGLIINNHIPLVAERLENTFFIHIERHPFYNMQSLLRARQSYYGEYARWYSFKPPQYPQIKDLPVRRQVAGQIHYINRTIREALSAIDERRYLQIDYASFCRRPGQWWRLLMDKMKTLGEPAKSEYQGPACFQSKNQQRCDKEEARQLIEAWRDITGEEIQP